jgi:hypothetical protein
VTEARIRRARELAPVDVLPELEPAEWAMAGVLNDLLQVGNEELSGFSTRGRHETLLRATRATATLIPPPASLGAALARHATFARLLGTAREDVRVSWWTGSALFRGRRPHGRLLLWPELRRVTTDSTRVPLVDMADWAPVAVEEYHEAIGALLSGSPVTDLATCARTLPPFRWSRATLGLVATVAGCDLALRAFARLEPSAAIWSREGRGRGGAALQALERAAAALPTHGPARGIAAGFGAELSRALAQWFPNTQAA